MVEHFGDDILRDIFPSTPPALLLGLMDEEGINQVPLREARLAQKQPQEEPKRPHRAVGGAVACASELPRLKNQLPNLFLLCSGDLSLRISVSEGRKR